MRCGFRAPEKMIYSEINRFSIISVRKVFYQSSYSLYCAHRYSDHFMHRCKKQRPRLNGQCVKIPFPKIRPLPHCALFAERLSRSAILENPAHPPTGPGVLSRWRYLFIAAGGWGPGLGRKKRRRARWGGPPCSLGARHMFVCRHYSPLNRLIRANASY